jgi:hypothetical protein
MAEEAIYGHVTYIESTPKVIRSDQTVEDAVINLPLAPGDIIETDGDSRCEFQFDNGTVMRLDKDSRLKIVTVLAKSLTSKWKITTIELQKGKLYSINQAYNMEKFQVITPNAAIHLKRSSKSIIGIGANEETNIAVFRGKPTVMFGGEVKSLKKKSIKSGQGYIITKDNKLIEGENSNFEFLTWNQYVDKNFKKLHYGISKVPAKIYTYNKAIVYWAEKWSSLFGEWVYHDIFGYVWQPADKFFAYSARPFFHAKFTRVNGKLFLVPSQPWGWTPAHLGTWVWLKRGWTWIPGSAFRPGFMSYQSTSMFASLFGSFRSYVFPWHYLLLSSYSVYPHSLGYYGIYPNTLSRWLGLIYGGSGYNSYLDYREGHVKNPSLKRIPADIKQIIKTMNKAPVDKLKDALKGTPRKVAIPKIYSRVKLSQSSVTSQVKQRLQSDKSKAIKEKAAKVISPKGAVVAPAKRGIIAPLSDVRYFRDFNPDKRAMQRIGASIKYSTLKNSIVCPQLKIASHRMSSMDRHVLRTTIIRNSIAGARGLRTMGSQGYSGSDSTSSANTRSTQGGRVGGQDGSRSSSSSSRAVEK